MKNIVLALVGTTALTAGLAFITPNMEAQAAAIGTIDIGGDATLGTAGVSYSDVEVEDTTGVFSVIPIGTPLTMSTISLPSFSASNPVVFGSFLSFDFDEIVETTFRRGFLAAALYEGTWTVRDESYKGTLSFAVTKTGSATNFSTTGEAVEAAVPEPLTFMGAGLAVALGAAFKKQASKSQS